MERSALLLSISIRPSSRYRVSALQRTSEYLMAPASSDFADTICSVADSHWCNASSSGPARCCRTQARCAGALPRISRSTAYSAPMRRSASVAIGERSTTNPLRERRAIEIDTGASVDSLLPIQWTVVAVLGDDHLREQSRSGKAAIKRPRGRWQLNDRCTMATGELRAYMPQHLEVARYVIEHLGDVFAELAHLRTALRTAAARRRVHDRFARQVGGQRTWHAAQPCHALL